MTTAISSATRNLAAASAGGDSDSSKVTVFDMENKVIGYTGVFTVGVKEVFSEWGNIYILTNDGQVRLYTPSCFSVFVPRLTVALV